MPSLAASSRSSLPTWFVPLGTLEGLKRLWPVVQPRVKLARTTEAMERRPRRRLALTQEIAGSSPDNHLATEDLSALPPPETIDEAPPVTYWHRKQQKDTP